MKKYFITTIILISIFCGLLILSSSINYKNVEDNVEDSLVGYNFYDSIKYNLNVDNYTDMIILNLITYENDSILKESFECNYGISYVDKYGIKEVSVNQYQNLKDTLNNENDDSIMYGRYWHGYQVILKPILNFLNYHQSLTFLLIVGIILIIFSCVLILRKLDWKVLITYLLSLISLNIYMFSTCYQYFLSMIIMIAFVIFLLLKYNDKFDVKLCFFGFGALTTYFCYVSFPLITLCFPLLILLCLNIKNKKYQNYKENIQNIFQISISWFVGFVLFFLIKWVLGTLLFGQSFIENALMSVTQRLGVTFSFKYLDVLKLNLNYFFNIKFNIIIFILGFILLIFKLRKNFISKIKVLSPLIIIFLMPFVWMFVCNNHSAIHFWMISRLFSISCFALLLMNLILFDKNIKFDNLEKLNKDDYCILISLISFVLLYKIKFIYIILWIILVFVLKVNKKTKIFVGLIICLNLFLMFSQLLSKKNFNDKEFFQSIYNELYNKAKMYGDSYILKNNVEVNEKVNIRDLIENINGDSVFLLECEGYIIATENGAEPYINCDNIIVTPGYENN